MASSHPAQSLFRAWIAALALFLLLLAWAFFALRAPAGSPGAAQAPTEQQRAVALQLPAAPVPAFNATGAPLLLTAFSLTGLHLTDNGTPLLTMREPGSRFAAQAIARDASPRVLTEGLRLAWQLEAPYAGANDPAARRGDLTPDPDGGAFVSGALPLEARAENIAFAPYPTVLVRAEAAEAAGKGADGRADIETRLVLPVSSEMGCRNCHGGPWKDGGFGLGEETARDILRVHDKRNGTSLLARADKGDLAHCGACHSGGGERPGLSAALHGFHAAMRPQGAEACNFCHASDPDGGTRFYRGLHDMWGLDCTRCHGDLAGHAVSLLKYEAERGVKAARARLQSVAPLAGSGAEDIRPRQPGENLPQCAGCHDFSIKPDPAEASAFNKWTASAAERFTRATDNTGLLRCPSCHGAPHALYPAANPAGDERDNLQPLQYQGMAAPLGKDGNCAVCHTVDMDGFIHHDLPE